MVDLGLGKGLGASDGDSVLAYELRAGHIMSTIVFAMSGTVPGVCLSDGSIAILFRSGS